MWIFFEIITDNPFIFMVIFMVLVLSFATFLFIENPNESNDEAIFFSNLLKPFLAFVFIFASIVGVAFYIEEFAQKKVSDRTQGIERKFGMKVDKNEKEVVPVFVPNKLGGKVYHSGGWTLLSVEEKINNHDEEKSTETEK